MTAIHPTLERLTLGDVSQAGSLTMIPLFDPLALAAPDYTLFDTAEAEAEGIPGDSGESPGMPDRTAIRVSAETFLQSVCAADLRAFEAVGEGEDLRLIDETVTGGALHARGRLIHLCAFAANVSHELARKRCGPSALVPL